MQSAKEKLSNMACAAKENVNIYKAKAEEKMEKATAKTEEQREIASDVRKAKEAKAEMELQEAKAEHAAEKLTASAKKSHVIHGQNHPAVGDRHDHDGARLHKTTVPAYPLGGYGTHKFPLQ
ncbi:late embryogenesis abundant protein 6 [Prunus yedoensis var. nudiflora]|uniref:Late embryogenesis abundant protein 6 n=1 Tax=Prunus yedoensis var. nudiflora TaxID=2094558 RepID=A0A314UR41_PRUYE|nr:late embryogenesis abundant protein 6 [Prunus yedoensis var. nudiflora]